MIVVKKSSKKSQYLRNCGHFLGRTFLLFHTVLIQQHFIYLFFVCTGSLFINDQFKTIKRDFNLENVGILFATCILSLQLSRSFSTYCNGEKGNIYFQNSKKK